jgi:hypothetical protein
MFNSTSNHPSIVKILVTTLFIVGLTISPLALAQEHEHAPAKGSSAAGDESAGTKEVTGEVLDLMCYIDHGAMGEKHAACATKCVKSGGPVGILSNGKAYIVVGEHQPINDELADYCGKTITLKGKVSERSGLSMIENAEIVKK